MPRVIYNKHIDQNYYLIKVETKDVVEPGQFYMLRAWDKYPVLSRPISVFDVEDDGVLFLYEVRGTGTKIIKDLKAGDEIKIDGPHGNHFEYKGISELSIVGGSVGIAPFYYLIKKLQQENPDVEIDFYLGEREEQNLEKVFEDLKGINLIIKKGGFITDELKFEKKLIYTCGPQAMMNVVNKLAKENDCKAFLSLENRMGCGVGACLSCTCKTKEGNKRACVEGPIFEGSSLEC